MRILDIATTKNYEIEGIVLNKKTVEEVYEKFFKENIENLIDKKDNCFIIPYININGEKAKKYSKEKLVNFFKKNGFFEIVSFSKEDLERTKYYEDNKEREKAKSYFKDYDEFLKSLEMKAEINFAKPIYFDRITQLINKTNQFNLTTKRYTLAEVENIASSKDRMLIYGRLKDKFGDNGLITIIIGSIKNNEFHIDLWLMSCRVLKREMENAMLDFLVEYCKKNSIKKIYGYYYKTPKNNMVKDFYKEMGFKNLLLNNEKSEWVLEVDEISDIKNKVIEIGEY